MIHTVLASIATVTGWTRAFSIGRRRRTRSSVEANRVAALMFTHWWLACPLAIRLANQYGTDAFLSTSCRHLLNQFIKWIDWQMRFY